VKSTEFPKDAVIVALSNRFSQSSFLEVGHFTEFLENRGLMSMINGEEELEFLDREGLVRPIFRLRLVEDERIDPQARSILISPETLRYSLKSGLIDFPEVGDYRQWSTFGEGFNRSVMFFYHPAQAYFIENCLSQIQFKAYIPDLKGMSEQIVKDFNERYQWFKGKCTPPDDERDRKRLSLLILLETPYGPLCRRRIRLGILLDRYQYEEWENWKDSQFDPHELLTRTGLSLEDVIHWRDSLASHARFIDPLESWYLLTRIVSYEKRKKLKGRALLCQDYYEYVLMLNAFIQELTGESQPEPDEMGATLNRSWRKRVYGNDFDLSNDKTKKLIVDEYLYPEVIFTRLMLIVEGDSEQVFIEELSNALGWTIGTTMQLENLGGYSGLGKLEPLLKHARKQGIVPFVILDPHPGVKDLIAEYVGIGLLKDDCHKIWTTGFEEDNYPNREILDAFNQLVKNRGYVLSEHDIKSHSRTEKPFMECIRETLFKRFRVELDDVVSKSELSKTLIQRRLKEISMELKNGKYVPKLELEKILYSIRREFLVYHIVL